MFAATLSGAPSTPSEEIVVFEDLDEEEVDHQVEKAEHVEVDQGGKAEHVEVDHKGGRAEHVLEEEDILQESKVVEAQTEYNVAVFKRLL